MKFFKSILTILICLFSQVSLAEKTCTYTTYKWNTTQRKAVEFETIQHPYSELQQHETDEYTGCTVCQEDQIEIKIGKLKPVKMCKILAIALQRQLSQLNERDHLAQQNMPILKLIGYRVGMTRGKADKQGNRTLFSNHSFGIALDINDQQNGLYDQCTTFGPHCRLIKGGKWHPDIRGSITSDSEIVHLLKQLGFKWGGEIQGKQKDFMHFSPTGY